MTDVLVVAVFIVICTALGYMAFFGFDRWIANRVRAGVAHGQTIVFESRASQMSMGLSFMLGVRQGHLVVTEQALHVGSWVLPPFWKTMHIIPIRDIDKVTTLDILGMNQVHVTAQGKKFIISPYKHRLWPFAGGKGKELIAALQRGTDARFAAHVSTGFQDYIRSQIERKQ